MIIPCGQALYHMCDLVGTISWIFVHGMQAIWGDKVSMLTHTYTHKFPRKIEVAICNYQADNPLYM